MILTGKKRHNLSHYPGSGLSGLGAGPSSGMVISSGARIPDIPEHRAGPDRVGTLPAPIRPSGSVFSWPLRLPGERNKIVPYPVQTKGC